MTNIMGTSRLIHREDFRQGHRDYSELPALEPTHPHSWQLTEGEGGTSPDGVTAGERRPSGAGDQACRVCGPEECTYAQVREETRS